MKHIVLILCLFLASNAFGAQWYVTQSGSGTADGTSLTNAWSVAAYNASGTQTQPGDVVNLSGTITSQIVVPNGGAIGAPITVFFLPGANMTSPVWPTGAINLFEKNYVVIDGGGGAGMGGVNGNPGLANGSISCTSNGTGLANQSTASGVYAQSCLNLTVQNLQIGPIYTRTAATDVMASGSCISNPDSNGTGCSNFIVTNCILHDAQTGIASDYGPNEANYVFSFNTVYNCNWGGNCGDRGSSSSISGLVVHDNHFYNWANWDSPTDIYHHNGFYAWAESGGTLINPVFYNNMIGPGYGTNQTSGIFISCSNGTVSGSLIYNNLFFCNQGEDASNGLITVGGAGLLGTHGWFNNDFILGGVGNAIDVTGGSGNATINIINNLCYGNGGGTFAAIFGAANLNANIDYNISAAMSANQPYSFSSNGNGSFLSFSQWQALGYDPHGSNSSPQFVNPGAGNFQLAPTDTVAVDNGTDLSAYFAVDMNGVTRPQGLAWDIGCFEQVPPSIPIIVTQPSPASQVVAPGSTVTYNALGRGIPLLSGQWWLGSSIVPGATGNTLTILSATPSNNGTYTFVSSNSNGSVTSNPVSLVVTNAAYITTEPVNVTVPTGQNATFSVTAIGNPLPNYQWQFNGTNLTDGGIISGSTTSTLTLTGLNVSNAGNYTVVASNSLGTSVSTPATLTVLTPPVFTTQPTTGLIIPPNGSATFTAVASGNPAPNYSWFLNGNPLSDGGSISGSATSTLSISSASAANSGTYTVVATNSVGSATSSPATLLVSSGVPVITSQPVSQTVLSGSNVVLSVTATSNPTPTYQWNENGLPIEGATNSQLLLNNLTSASSGSYTVTITNTGLSVTSDPAVLFVQKLSRLINISTRAQVLSGSNILIAGLVISGGEKTVVLRAIGPTLAAFGLTNVLPNPLLQLDSGNTTISSNSSWGGTQTLSDIFAQVGAFALSDPNSADSAILTTLQPGPYTALVSSNTTNTGIALVEVYDTDRSDVPTSRLINLSARADVGTNGNVAIAGFVIFGDTPETVLIRAIGPTLSSFGVSGVLSSPLLQLESGQTILQQNSAWGGSSVLSNVFSQVGAFPLSNPNSNDAVILTTLQPGAYTAVVSGLNGSTGVALLEVYEVQ